MNEPRPVWWAVAELGSRIAERLRGDAGERAEASWGRVLAFLDRQWAQARAEAPMSVSPVSASPWLERLALSEDERTLLLLALMPEAHEGYGAAFAALHPRGESRPTWGLLGWLLCEDLVRAPLLRLAAQSPLLALGLVRVPGEAPWPERSLLAAPGLWSALHGVAQWPQGLQPQRLPDDFSVPDAWLDGPAAEARRRLGGREPLLVLLQGPQGHALRLRAQQLAAVCRGALIELPAEVDAAALAALLGQCLALDLCPMLLGQASLPMELLDAYPAPLLLAGVPAAAVAGSARALLSLDAAPPMAGTQARLWAQHLPELATHGPLLGGRQAIGPDTLQQLRQDLAPWLAQGAAPPLERCVAALKARTSRSDDSFARRIVPQADWADLVLPAERVRSLQAAVQRMRHQQQVFDDWGFGRRQPQARGLRLLFSGLPGTGKTLAAEVIAKALHADLLVIDLSRLVSKWIGETEKNLATAFDQAEGTGAVLFFDEADALFGKRTEVSDAHDRYANLESAYLLARLERFDGVAVLATNLRANLDKAFLRRFELTLEFNEPAPAERAAIWRAQFPSSAPRAPDVDFEELAALHALPGALIRNAALGAAFMAAAEGSAIARRHVEAALRAEYDKAGRVGPH